MEKVKQKSNITAKTRRPANEPTHVSVEAKRRQKHGKREKTETRQKREDRNTAKERRQKQRQKHGKREKTETRQKREDRNTVKERRQKHGKEPGQKCLARVSLYFRLKNKKIKKNKPAVSQRWCARIGHVEFAMSNVDGS